MNKTALVGILAVLAAVVAVLFSGGPSIRIDQSRLCLVSSDEEALKCKPGRLMYFQARRWGNDQLPTNIAAAYCDFNYQVMHTPGSVLCVYTDKRRYLVESN